MHVGWAGAAQGAPATALGVGLEWCKGTKGKGRIVATVGGKLRLTPPDHYWVETNTRVYRPRREDAVIGVVEDRNAMWYKVNIFGSMSAILPALAFQGATKRTKPVVKIGDVVYARVVSADAGVEPELSCVAVHGPKKEWTTGEATFGVLAQGMLVRCTSKQAAALRDHESQVLQALGKEMAYEITIGTNGAIWVRARSAAEMVAIVNAIKNSFVLEAGQVPSMVNAILKRIRAGDDDESSDDDGAGR